MKSCFTGGWWGLHITYYPFLTLNAHVVDSDCSAAVQWHKVRSGGQTHLLYGVLSRTAAASGFLPAEARGREAWQTATEAPCRSLEPDQKWLPSRFLVVLIIHSFFFLFLKFYWRWNELVVSEKWSECEELLQGREMWSGTEGKWK